MKTENAIKMLSDLRQLINHWELELNVKPLWWQKYRATRGGEVVGAATREAKFELASSGKRDTEQSAFKPVSSRSRQEQPYQQNEPAAVTLP
jgi:hypothetical protein